LITRAVELRDQHGGRHSRAGGHAYEYERNRKTDRHRADGLLSDETTYPNGIDYAVTRAEEIREEHGHREVEQVTRDTALGQILAEFFVLCVFFHYIPITCGDSGARPLNRPAIKYNMWQEPLSTKITNARIFRTKAKTASRRLRRRFTRRF
jgi:hypothetical protein